MNLNILILNFAIYLFGTKCHEVNSPDSNNDDSDPSELHINLPNTEILWDSEDEEIEKTQSHNKEKQKPVYIIQNRGKKETFDPTAYKDNRFFDIRNDEIPPPCKKSYKPRDCAEATYCTKRSGIYEIVVEKFNNSSFYVECDVKTDGGDWLTIQRREDGYVNFYRNWDDYVKGFGYVDGEFFIGLDKLYALTNYNGPQELMIIMIDKSVRKFAKYAHFATGNRNDYYTLRNLGLYSGNAGDSFTYHLRNKFSTKDRDNDRHNKINCAVVYNAGWWYRDCFQSNLNGRYGDSTFGKGINWSKFRPLNVSIQYVKMMIRRQTF